jgi:hypothetical protein
MATETKPKAPLDFAHLGGKQILAPPASNLAGKPAKIDLSDLYGDKGGLVFEAPNPEKPEAESVEPTEEERAE